jgi:hypothetical protein
MRRLFTLLAAIAAGALVPTTAQATHLHVIQVGNAACLILAENGHERFVTLPEASFKNTTEPTTPANPPPLHVHVHRGQPGERVTIAVFGSAADPCAATGNYLNR